MGKELDKVKQECKGLKEVLKKERDEGVFARTTEQLKNENLKIDLKSTKDEIRNIKNLSDLKMNDLESYVSELQRLLENSRQNENQATKKELEYRQKLNDMTTTVSTLEKNISEAVTRAESERNQREALLARLLEFDQRGMSKEEDADFHKFESEKWRKRAKGLTEDLEDLRDKFSRHRSKNMVDRETILSTVENAKAEQILNLKKELAETYKDKLANQSRLNNLSHELEKQRNIQQRGRRDFDDVTEELRRTRKNVLIQKTELDWLRNARSLQDLPF